MMILVNNERRCAVPCDISELMLLLFLRRHHQWPCALLSIPWQQEEQMQDIPAACLIV